jgi:outer membrane protein X
MSATTLAQSQGDMAAGGNLAFGSGDNFSNIGIGAKFQYNITDPIRLEGSFTYFLEKDYLSMWDFSVNAHYLFQVGEVRLYPLAGLGIIGSKYNLPSINFGGISLGGGSASDSFFGINIGGGIDYDLTEALILNAELKYKICDLDRLMLSVGLAYRF